MNYANSSSFFDFNWISFEEEMIRFRSIRGRLLCFKLLLQKIILLPFAFLFKAIGTSFRFLGLVASLALLMLSFGTSENARIVFCRRVAGFAADIADWVIFLFFLVSGFLRLIVGSTLHPAAYFR
jgi:hypothetical protein